MPLYGSAKAPAVRDAMGNQVQTVTDNSGGTSGGDTVGAIGATYSQAEVADAIATLAAKINDLIEHMNDGRSYNS